MKSNYERLIELADKVFAVRQDPEQLNVDENVIEKLQSIHPSTLSDKDFGEGPILWILLIPTTIHLMNRFLNHEINEKELYDLTMPNQRYDAVYLCSALVLEEHRKKGYAQEETINAIEEISKQHSIKSLFYWPFSVGGIRTAQAVAKKLDLPLYERK